MYDISCVVLQCYVCNIYLYGQIGWISMCLVLQCYVWNLYLYGQPESGFHVSHYSVESVISIRTVK